MLHLQHLNIIPPVAHWQFSHPSSSAEICSLNSATFSRSLSTKGSSSWGEEFQEVVFHGGPWYNNITTSPPHPQKKERVNKNNNIAVCNSLGCFLYQAVLGTVLKNVDVIFGLGNLVRGYGYNLFLKLFNDCTKQPMTTESFRPGAF